MQIIGKFATKKNNEKNSIQFVLRRARCGVVALDAVASGRPAVASGGQPDLTAPLATASGWTSARVAYDICIRVLTFPELWPIHFGLYNLFALVFPKNPDPAREDCTNYEQVLTGAEDLSWQQLYFQNTLRGLYGFSLLIYFEAFHCTLCFARH